MKTISMVAAYDKNRVIGQGDRIPWRQARDRAMLKRLTQGHTVILGRKSFDSMVWYYDRSGRPMPGKTYIIVTRNPRYKPARDSTSVAHSPEDALRQAQALAEDIYVIGGEHIFSALLPQADRLYVTKIQAAVDGDAYFPPLNMSEWREVSREHYLHDDKNEYDTDEIVFERIPR